MDRLVYHSQYHNWPAGFVSLEFFCFCLFVWLLSLCVAGGAPESAAGVLAMLHDVQGMMQQFPNTPLLVHDVLGGGPAGCIVAIENCIAQVCVGGFVVQRSSPRLILICCPRF
jgi:hypothetical protein